MPSEGLRGIAFALSYASIRPPGELSSESCLKTFTRLASDRLPLLVVEEATDASSERSGAG